MVDMEKVIQRCREAIDSHEPELDYCFYFDVIDLLKEKEAEIKQLKGYINGFSKDAIPVVRCKDCMKRPDEHETELNGKLYRYCELHRRWTTDDWFCADGRRKEGGEAGCQT